MFPPSEPQPPVVGLTWTSKASCAWVCPAGGWVRPCPAHSYGLKAQHSGEINTPVQLMMGRQLGSSESSWSVILSEVSKKRFWETRVPSHAVLTFPLCGMEFGPWCWDRWAQVNVVSESSVGPWSPFAGEETDCPSDQLAGCGYWTGARRAL